MVNIKSISLVCYNTIN